MNLRCACLVLPCGLCIAALRPLRAAPAGAAPAVLLSQPSRQPSHQPTCVQAAGKNDVAPNSYHDNPRPLRYWRQAGMEKRGAKCFDHQYYLQQNPDLKCALCRLT